MPNPPPPLPIHTDTQNVLGVEIARAAVLLVVVDTVVELRGRLDPEVPV